MNGSRSIILVFLQQRALGQLHINNMGTEKTRLLAYESIYWININVDLEIAMKIVLYVLTSRQHY